MHVYKLLNIQKVIPKIKKYILLYDIVASCGQDILTKYYLNILTWLVIKTFNLLHTSPKTR